ncbi:hypothetical protein BH23VER1_BH23VER1_32920 [soil metagenome]
MPALARAFLLLALVVFFTGQSAAEPAPVTIVVYNLKNYLKMDRRIAGEPVEDAPKPEPEIAALVALIVQAQPDILGVCEIGPRDDLADLQSRLASAGIALPHSDWMEAGDPVRHLALLSRFPIVARDHQTALRYRIDLTELAFQRGILDATVQVNPDYQLRALGLHLKSKRNVPEGDQELMRRNEAHLARKHIDAILAAGPDTNLLVFGDLNDTRNQPTVRAIQGRYGSPTYLRAIDFADPHGDVWTHYWSYADIYARIDFALASPGLYPEIVSGSGEIPVSSDWFLASDHRPLKFKFIPENARNP